MNPDPTKVKTADAVSSGSGSGRTRSSLLSKDILLDMDFFQVETIFMLHFICIIQNENLF